MSEGSRNPEATTNPTTADRYDIERAKDDRDHAQHEAMALERELEETQKLLAQRTELAKSLADALAQAMSTLRQQWKLLGSPEPANPPV